MTTIEIEFKTSATKRATYKVNLEGKASKAYIEKIACAGFWLESQDDGESETLIPAHRVWEVRVA